MNQPEDYGSSTLLLQKILLLYREAIVNILKRNTPSDEPIHLTERESHKKVICLIDDLLELLDEGPIVTVPAVEKKILALIGK